MRHLWTSSVFSIKGRCPQIPFPIFISKGSHTLSVTPLTGYVFEAVICLDLQSEFSIRTRCILNKSLRNKKLNCARDNLQKQYLENFILKHLFTKHFYFSWTNGCIPQIVQTTSISKFNKCCSDFVSHTSDGNYVGSAVVLLLLRTKSVMVRVIK